MEKEKIFELHFKVKKTITGVKDETLIGLASSLKLNGFKHKSIVVWHNLTKVQLAELEKLCFPPKISRQDRCWDRIKKDILSQDESLFCKSPQLKESLSTKEIVDKINDLANSTPCYTVKRQPTFFARETKVSEGELKTKFTQKAIDLMVEDGYLEEVKRKPFIYSGGGAEWQSIDFEELALKNWKEKNNLILGMMYGLEPEKQNGGKPNIRSRDELYGIDKLAFQPFFKKIELEKKNLTDNDVCELLENNIRLYQPNEKLDIFLSKSLYAELCQKFGGKVKKYKGHNIIVR